MNWKEFEEFSRKLMSQYFGTELVERNIEEFPKKFDMVSSNGDIVGDAKFLTLVHGTKLPPAKFMEIAAHMWLLEKVEAKTRFIVFGNQRRVAEWWLEKYGRLVKNITFYFVDADGSITVLN